MEKPPFAFGSPVYPGLAKLAEECGEVLQVVGKLIMTGGKSEHWDETNLTKRLEEEMADLQAALIFVQNNNFVSHFGISKRTSEKIQLFEKWHNEE